MSGAKDFLDSIAAATFSNEAEVETRLVEPLLHALGFTAQEIRPKYPVIFREGKKGRPTEADFAVFTGSLHDRDHSLIVVEAKHPSEKLENGQAQGESYAANLRAPFLLMTNGIDLQLWRTQITADSNLIVQAPVAALAGRWDELESMISKDAAQKYKEEIWRKSLTQINGALTPYISAELHRTEQFQSAIARRIYPFSAGDGGMVMSSDFLDQLDDGATIVAPSGFGKTTLAMLLFRQVLGKSGAPPQALVAEANLAEVKLAGLGIVDFACARVASHCPQITPGAFRHILRGSGAIFILDGFDRLTADVREDFQAQIKTLLRDFPATQILIFSRVSSRPAIDLPIFELREYSDEERRAYVAAELKSTGLHPSLPVTMLPETLQALFAIPLLFHLAFKYWLERKVYPSNLDGLLRSWLEALLHAGKLTPSRKIEAEVALRLFARESQKGAMLATKVSQLFNQNGVPDGMIDDLVQCDALRIEGRSIELVHEILGDYLRACDVAESDPAKLPEVLRTVPLSGESMFPVLLCSMLKSRDNLNIVLSRLATSDLHVYFDALRYRANNSEQFMGSKREFAAAYLEDMLDGLEQPRKAFFGQLSTFITASLAGEPSDDLAINGSGSRQWINYEFLPLAQRQRVTVGPFGDNPQIRGSNLRLLGLRPDSGRLLAASILKETLSKLPDEGLLHGGLEWRSERLVGWVRFLIEKRGFPITLDVSLADLRKELEKFSGKIISSHNFRPARKIPVDVLLEDISALMSRGDTHLNVWWKKFGGADQDILANEADTRGLFAMLYRRIQIVYKEVVEHSFADLRHMFGFYTSMPVRWDIIVPPRRDELGMPWIQYRWLPVRTWEEAGADLAIVSEPPARFERSELSETQDQIRKMGRLTKYTHIWQGSGVAPRFDGRSMISGYDGQTIVMQEVCEYIEDDIKRLFEHRPGSDIPYFEIDRDSPWDTDSEE